VQEKRGKDEEKARGEEGEEVEESKGRVRKGRKGGDEEKGRGRR
jgi:hypothetical protein